MPLEQIAVSAYKLGLVLLSAKVLEGLFKRAGLPGVAGSITAGLLLGPSILGLVRPHENPHMTLFIVLGLDFLLFLAGAEELAELSWRKIGHKELGLGLAVFASSFTLVVLALAPVDALSALLLGAAMGIVSVGPMTKTLVESGLSKRRPVARLLIAGLIAEVAGIVVFDFAAGEPGVQKLVAAALMLVGVLAFGRLVLVYALRAVERLLMSREATFAVIVALVLSVGYLAHSLGLSSAIVALLLGLFSSTYLAERPSCLEKLHAFTYGFFEPLFFAGIGLYVSTISPHVSLVAALLALLAALPKVAIGRVFLGSFRQASLLASKGGVDAALLLAAAPQLGGDLYSAGVLAITSMAVFSAVPLHAAKHRALEAALKAQDLAAKVYLREEEPLEKAARLLTRIPAVVVVDEGDKPVGVLRAVDVLRTGGSRVVDAYTPHVASIHASTPVSELLVDEAVAEAPVVAVVDDNGRLVGAIWPQRLLSKLREHKLV